MMDSFLALFASSFIKLVLVCSRPAVSMMSTSQLRARAADLSKSSYGAYLDALIERHAA